MQQKRFSNSTSNLPKRHTERMVIEEPIPVPSWLETTSTDYKLIDFDRGAFEGTTMAVDRNTVTDGSTSVLTNLFSSGQTSTWSSLLVTALSENLTTFMNNTELLGPTASFDQAQRQLIDSGYTLGRCDNGSEIFNCTAQEYMEYMRGPQTLPLQQAIFVSWQTKLQLTHHELSGGLIVGVDNVQ